MKSKPVVVLDACSIINLIYTEMEYGSEIVSTRLQSDEFHLCVCDRVIEEALQNAKVRLKKLMEWERKSGSYSDNEFYEKEHEIESKIARLRHFMIQKETVTKDFGNEYYSCVKNLSCYKKENGEFYSAALSLYASRREGKQLTFYTDDLPAHADFYAFFKEQQIGKIEDSIDLLVFLYWTDADFSKKQLEFFLTELRSQYVTDVNMLFKYISIYKEKQNIKKIKSIRNALNELESRLQSYELEGINHLRKEICRHENQHKHLCEKLKETDNVFRMESGTENNLIDKIQNTLKNLEEDRICKIV